MEKKNKGIIRVALIGPESSAKSTLSEALAKHYGTVWVPERSRTYLAGIAHKYTLDDIVQIAHEQLQEESEKLSLARRLLFADTELIIAKVWCEDVFQTCPEWITDTIRTDRYDLYLLTAPDLEWVEDPLRENPFRREYFFGLYKKELENLGAEYSVIAGFGQQRLDNAISAVEKFLASHKN